MLTPASEAELSEAVAAAGGPLRIWVVARGPSDGRWPVRRCRWPG
jgi:hypothetical protein